LAYFVFRWFRLAAPLKLAVPSPVEIGEGFPLVQAGGSIEANVITESSSLTWVFRWFKLAAIPNSTIPLWRKVSRIFR
jgi:hypothetical protein